MYVFDTGIFINLFFHYYQSRFPTLWANFDSLLSDEQIISTLENLREIEARTDDLSIWAKENEHIFLPTNKEEAEFVKKIFQVPHFQQNISKQQYYKGGKNADPFLIAKAAVLEAHVVTTELHKPNAAKIPNICEHFSVSCLNFEQFMEKEGWSF